MLWTLCITFEPCNTYVFRPSSTSLSWGGSSHTFHYIHRITCRSQVETWMVLCTFRIIWRKCVKISRKSTHKKWIPIHSPYLTKSYNHVMRYDFCIPGMMMKQISFRCDTLLHQMVRHFFYAFSRGGWLKIDIFHDGFVKNNHKFLNKRACGRGHLFTFFSPSDDSICSVNGVGMLVERK